MRYSYRKEGDLIPAYMSHELGEILPNIINISKSKIWDDWLQLTQYFPNRDSRYYEAAYVRYNAYDSPTEVYSGFGETEAESRAMLLFDLLEKKILTPDGLNLKEVDRRKEYENEFGLTEDECRKLQEESESFNDEMIKFIDNMFGRENMISEGSTISENDTICINIKYHKIGEVFNYKVGMSEMTLRVDKCDRCSGCAFENYIYDCVKSGCLGCEREDGESVRYTIVNT